MDDLGSTWSKKVEVSLKTVKSFDAVNYEDMFQPLGTHQLKEG